MLYKGYNWLKILIVEGNKISHFRWVFFIFIPFSPASFPHFSPNRTLNRFDKFLHSPIQSNCPGGDKACDSGPVSQRTKFLWQQWWSENDEGKWWWKKKLKVQFWFNGSSCRWSKLVGATKRRLHFSSYCVWILRT